MHLRLACIPTFVLTCLGCTAPAATTLDSPDRAAGKQDSPGRLINVCLHSREFLSLGNPVVPSENLNSLRELGFIGWFLPVPEKNTRVFAMSLADSTISSNVQDLGFSLSSAGVFAFLNPVNTYREIPGCSQEFPETLTVTMTVGVSPYSNDPSQNLAKSTVKKLYSKGYSLIDQTIRRISSEPSAPSDGCEQFPGPGIYIPPTGVLLDEDILCFVEPNPNDLLAVAQSHRDVSLQGIASLAQEFELANGEQPVFVTWERFETVLGLVQAAITLLYNGFLGSPEPAF